MECVWDDHPIPDGPFFSRDLYDKYALSPHIRELWAFLQSPSQSDDIKQECDVGLTEASSSMSKKDAADLKDNSCISSQVSCWESCDSDAPCGDNGAEGNEVSKHDRKSRAKQKQNETEAGDAYPEPRLPFPCVSSLTSKEQKTYVAYLMSKKGRSPAQSLKTRLNNEVMQFMKYLQDVAKVCAEDYNFISQGAMQYSEEFFGACLECVKTLPQFYQIHEMTSLTGGTFNPGLALTFEKQLLTMGCVNITDHKIVPADAQLALDYQIISSENPPAKKAKDMHAVISSDGNAERLCASYEPHICLTRDALVRLLDNHGPDFREQWELPVLVKVNPGKVSKQKKTVYIDSPLLKTEITVRERGHIYHGESLKLSIMKNGSRKVFHLMTERPANEQQISPEASRRSCVPVDSSGLDFEADLTDLETFGESTTTKTCVKKKSQDEQDGVVMNKKTTSSPVLSGSKRSSEHLDRSDGSSSQDKMHNSLTNVDPKTSQLTVNKTILPKTDPLKQGSSQESDQDQAFTEDSDDERLAIDESVSPTATPVKEPVDHAPESTPVNTNSSSPHKGTRSRPQSKRTKISGDQLGEILRMQTAMFKSGNGTPATKSPSRCVEPLLHSHTTSLVKPCVTSYLERHQNEDGEACAAPHESAVIRNNAAGHKKILSEDLQACAEDEQDYDSPVEGNLIYKLYSLQDLLLLVRSSVSLTHTRNVGSSQNQYVPVHVLPKLEYQLAYGVECLTSSEACQLWTETLLHSSTISYIAHINAHTSKVALLRKLPDDWKQNISCGFKPPKSLNILHHLLKKLAGLEEGQYLITHKAGEPFVTLLKAAKEKVGRAAYNLQQIHSSVPQPPASGHVPWIPVDPAVVLPFHQKHGRVPCTFPPKTIPTTSKEGRKNHGGGQNNPNPQGNKKKGKQKRAARRNKYIKNLIQKSI
ncbi:little elongation complex subunit 2 [Melanotaenia boesemani]|uniref:little elongation complex subunit 2 n=1 Tax=Melanotaenia boesemani TaxID=1250792 RepID=UPI001C04B299|nr:little elongation complex subunit 2 [Melanotaenia boesemani]